MVKIRRKSVKYGKPNKPKKKFYSFLTIALLFCIFILGYSSVLNILKLMSYQVKIADLKKIQSETLDINESLKKQLQDLDAKSYEAIARNNLKMSGKDEVLIIVKEDEEQPKKDKKKKKN